MDSMDRLRSKPYIMADDGQYVPSHIKNQIAPQMMDSTCLLMSKLESSPDDGQYVSSQVNIVELPR